MRMNFKRIVCPVITLFVCLTSGPIFAEDKTVGEKVDQWIDKAEDIAHSAKDKAKELAEEAKEKAPAQSHELQHLKALLKKYALQQHIPLCRYVQT